MKSSFDLFPIQMEMALVIYRKSFKNLEYLKELGIKGLWLMPVHPLPTYHTYDD